jgi:DNA repair protein RadC
VDARDNRPRERLWQSGPHALTDVELLALVLGHGSRGLPSIAIASRLLAAAGDLRGLTRLGPAHVAATPGLGAAQTCRVLAAIELGRRTLTLPRPASEEPVTTDVFARYLLPRYGAFARERFGILLLGPRHRILRAALLSDGAEDRAVAEPREVFREAAASRASALVLFHNHPSGDPTPSPADFRTTRRMVLAGRIVGIHVVDHLVLADAAYSSIFGLQRTLWEQ